MKNNKFYINVNNVGKKWIEEIKDISAMIVGLTKSIKK